MGLEKKTLYFFKKKENEKTNRELTDAFKSLIDIFDQKTILAVEAGLICELRAYLERALGDVLLDQNIAITRLKEALDFLRDLLDRNRDEVEMSYTVRGASWQTSYDASLDTGSGNLALSVSGEITQASGEDWDEAPITLSSAETETGIAVPELHPVGLTGYAEKIVREMVTQEEEIDDLTPTGGAGEGPPAQAAETGGAARKGASVTFVLAGSGGIPADGLSHRLLIRRDAVRPALSYETIPA